MLNILSALAILVCDEKNLNNPVNLYIFIKMTIITVWENLNFVYLFYAWNWMFQSILYFFQGKITTINLDMRNCQLSKCVLQITVINHNTSKMPPFCLRYSSTSTRSCRKASMALEKHKKCFLTVIKQNKHTQYHIRCLKKFHYCADKS